MFLHFMIYVQCSEEHNVPFMKSRDLQALFTCNLQTMALPHFTKELPLAQTQGPLACI